MDAFLLFQSSAPLKAPACPNKKMNSLKKGNITYNKCQPSKYKLNVIKNRVKLGIQHSLFLTN